MNIVERDHDRDVIAMDEPVDLSPDLPQVIATTRGLVPDLASSAALAPFDEQEDKADRYRAELRERAPRVAGFAHEMARRFEQGTMAVLVPSLGIAALPLEIQRYALFALGYLLGTPTATEPRDRRVLWDVKVRSVTRGQFTTFSEDDSEAELHTDSEFRADPEPIFFLYVVQAACCDGGTSYFANGHRLRDRLTQTASGRDAMALLSQAPVPFRIPPAFSVDPAVAEYNAATVFADQPLVRFRHDVILRALDANPTPGQAEIREAVNLVAATALAVKTSERQLPTGAIVLVDNHNALHGRSRFRDAERHLIRVRIAA
jgi:alpha-ketoglutarate-dependent taurine dioxygenase